MNEQLQAELRAMREEQRSLRQRLGVLDDRLRRFETGADEATAEAALPPSAAAPPAPSLAMAATPPPLPPPPVAAKTMVRAPLSLSEIAADAGWRSTRPSAPAPSPAAPDLPPPVPPAALAGGPAFTAIPSGPPPPKPRESLEMQIGSTWLVRAGIVLALTALAFTGIALYQNVVPHLGPAGKVALLYLGAGALTGAGAWLERSRQARENPSLQNYAQVVFAGGLAAVYYVTYVAHYFERLRVIENAILAGAMLLAWTAFMVLLAHRRNSETLATLAILLAYYTSAINDGVESFTLFSNLALTAGAVFLLRRHLWKVFPFASVLATFGSYGFWTYYHSILSWPGFGAPPVHANHGTGGFWIEAAFLFVYWALFSWAAFTATEGVLPSLRRAGFVSLNNSAYFLLTTWLVLGQGPGWFWKWALGFGVVLLALAEIHRRFARRADARMEDAYLLQGVLLVTTGFVAYFEGWQLSLVLAIQAVALLAAAGRRSSAALLGCSLASAGLAFLWAVHSFDPSVRSSEWVTPLAVGGVLVGAAALAQRFKDRRTAEAPGSPLFRNVLDPAPSIDALLGCIVWLWLIGTQAPGTNTGILEFAGAALALTASVYVLRVKALTLYAQAFLGLGCLVWASEDLMQFSPGSAPNAWTTLGPLVAALALGHWWQRLPGSTGWQRGKLSRTLSALDAVWVVVVVLVWFVSRHWSWQRQDGIASAGLAGLALVVFGYAAATRYRALAMASQGLLLASVLCFVELMDASWDGNGRLMLSALAPLLATLAMLIATRFIGSSGHPSVPDRIGTVFYEILATVLFLGWAERYLPAEILFPLLTLAGALVFALGVDRQVQRWTLLSIAPTVVGVYSFLVFGEGRASFAALLGVLFLAGQQQFGKRRLGAHPSWFPVGWQAALMGAATVCAWIFVSARVEGWHNTSGTLAAGWSVLAASVFAAGLLWRERVYRWLGLLVMGATFGHVALFDLMQLDIVGKAISFAALAAVLLGVGFLYNKYQSKFRDFL